MEVIHDEERDDRVRSDSDDEGWESDPKSEESFSGHSLTEAIDESFVRENSVGASLLLLELGLNVVEWQGNAGADDT